MVRFIQTLIKKHHLDPISLSKQIPDGSGSSFLVRIGEKTGIHPVPKHWCKLLKFRKNVNPQLNKTKNVLLSVRDSFVYFKLRYRITPCLDDHARSGTEDEAVSSLPTEVSRSLEAGSRREEAWDQARSHDSLRQLQPLATHSSGENKG